MKITHLSIAMGMLWGRGSKNWKTIIQWKLYCKINDKRRGAIFREHHYQWWDQGQINQVFFSFPIWSLSYHFYLKLFVKDDKNVTKTFVLNMKVSKAGSCSLDHLICFLLFCICNNLWFGFDANFFGKDLLTNSWKWPHLFPQSSPISDKCPHSLSFRKCQKKLFGKCL